MTRPHIDHIAQEIIRGLSLREKAAIANLDESNLPYLQHALATIIAEDDELNPEVLFRIWHLLQATHRVRRVQ